MVMRATRLALLLVAGLALSAGAEQVARPEVGERVKEAQALLERKDFAAALARLDEAEAAKDKTPYEVYVIEATRASAELGAGDDAAALKALEATLASGIPAGAERLARIETEAELAFRLKSYDAALAYAQHYYQEGGTAPTLRPLIAEAFCLKGDFAAAEGAARDVVAAEVRSGKAADENLLLLMASSAAKQGDDAGYRDALTRLVASHPKPDYWRALLAAVARMPGFAPRLALDLDRLRIATGTLESAGQYMEAAERALSDGFPGDARAFLEQGRAAGILGEGADKAKEAQLLDMATRQAREDATSFPALAKEAAAAADGAPWEKLGEAYASLGRYEQAIAAYEHALGKGGLKHPDDARLHLGIAALDGGDKVRAKKALAAVAGHDGSAALASLWLVYAGAERPM